MHELAPISIVGAALGLPLSFLARLFYHGNQIYFSVLYGLCFLIAFIILTYANHENTRIKLQVLIRSFFLGWTFSLGTVLIIGEWTTPFGLYLCTMSHFHYSEFLVTSVINPSTLSLDSFLLNHSTEYGVAALASWIEFLLEAWCFPWLKDVSVLVNLGLAMCIVGEILRKGAMLTAFNNFTHLVRHEKVDGHELVTHGLYSLCRHPAYAGWFWWSLGTQLILVNPVCLVGYTVASYRFFKDRIYYEEICLLSFFQSKYVDYQKKVKSTGVPFVKGYVLEQTP